MESIEELKNLGLSDQKFILSLVLCCHLGLYRFNYFIYCILRIYDIYTWSGQKTQNKWVKKPQQNGSNYLSRCTDNPNLDPTLSLSISPLFMFIYLLLWSSLLNFKNPNLRRCRKCFIILKLISNES